MEVLRREYKNTSTASVAVDMLHELIRKHEECIHEIQVMSARDLPPNVKVYGILPTLEPGATPHDTAINLRLITKDFNTNTQQEMLLNFYLCRLCEGLYHVSQRYISTMNSPYGINHLWNTPEGRREWETLRWINWGIPQLVHDRLGKYPSIKGENGKLIEILPQCTWQLEDNILKWEAQIACSGTQKRWHPSISDRERKVWHAEKKNSRSLPHAKVKQYLKQLKK